MEKYKFSKHTADAKFKAFGKTLDEAFKNAALAMFSLMVDSKEIEGKITKDIWIKEADDQKSLLYKWLEELLFLFDTKGFLVKDVRMLRVKDKGKFELMAKVVGDTFKEQYELHGDVKAVTYHDMEIKKEKGKFSVRVVLDL
jgi:SHS2 domain-containing protein